MKICKIIYVVFVMNKPRRAGYYFLSQLQNSKTSTVSIFVFEFGRLSLDTPPTWQHFWAPTDCVDMYFLLQSS
jgi:hypothetical protein